MERAQREAKLIAELTEQLPAFVAMCQSDIPVVILHQDTFAADYQEQEYGLLGKAVKFAGICGKELHIIGTNRESIEQPKKPS